MRLRHIVATLTESCTVHHPQREVATHVDQMIIGEPAIQETGQHSRWAVPVEAEGLPDSLWYEVPREFEGLLTDRADPALVALLIPAMRFGLQVVINGVVTEELGYRVSRGYQSILQSTHSLAPVPISFSKVSVAGARASGVATGFSAGVDSFATLADHHYDPSIGSWGRITHLINNNVGSHEAGRDLWRARVGEKTTAAGKLGLPLISVDSNLDEFYPAGSYMQSHTARDSSVAHLLAGGVGRWFYASGIPLSSAHCFEASDPAYSEPFVLPALSTPALALNQHGELMTRVQKIALIAELQDAQEYLDVCVDSKDGSNCSRCYKCLRTMFTLELLGKLELFSSRFDLEVYLAHRNASIGHLMVGRGPAAREIRALMRHSGFKVPASAYWATSRKALATARRYVTR